MMHLLALKEIVLYSIIQNIFCGELRLPGKLDVCSNTVNHMLFWHISSIVQIKDYQGHKNHINVDL